MRKTKILMNGMSSNLGGIEVFIYNFYKNLDKEKYEFNLLVLDYGKKVAYEDELIANGVNLYKITPRSKNYFKFRNELKEVYKNGNFDVIHLNLMNLACPERITFAYKYSNAKIIIHSHHASSKDISFVDRVMDNFGRFLVKNIPCYRLACGQDAGKYLFKNKEFKVIQNGIDIDKFVFNEDNRKHIRNELNIKNNEKCMGLVAAFLPVKNHEFLMDIFNELIKEDSNYKLMLIGTGPDEIKIKKKAKMMNLSDKVLFLGKKNDANRYYSAMDLFVMPSISEGLSISLCEAQVNGLACYTSDGVDKSSNITGNAKFLSLKKSAGEWAKEICGSNCMRDTEVVSKVPKEFDCKNSYSKLFEFYNKISIGEHCE